MKQKLKKLIEISKVLDRREREFFLELVEILPQNRLEELAKIFEKEIQLVENVKNKAKEQKTKIFKDFVETADPFLKKLVRKFMKSEEQQEKEKADDVLKKLNDY